MSPAATSATYTGVAIAIVIDIDDPENEGRVRVKFPWLDNVTESDWCRVVQLLAGDGHGAFFSPEIDDEVLVAFMHGSARMPVVLGSLYNGQHQPELARNSGQNRDPKRILTKGGHEFLLDDSPQEKRVRLKTSAGHTIDLDDQNKKVTIKSTNGQTLTLDDQSQKATVEVGQCTLTLESAGTAKLEAPATVTIKGAIISLDASAQIKLGGDSATMSMIIGEQLLASFNTHTHNCTAPGAPSGPPLPPLTPSIFSTKIKVV
jgi:uncharacterized protein involved in type VI secretion and phage assembly